MPPMSALRNLIFLGYGLGAVVWAQGTATPGTSTGGAKAPMKIALSAEFGVHNSIPDLRYRRDVYEDALGERRPVPEERYAFLAQNFSLDFLLQNEGTYSSGLQVALGFRNPMSGGDTSPKGTEFTGYRILYRQSFWDGRLLNAFGYGLRRSDFLRLSARHHEYRLRFDYVPDPTALDPNESPFFVRVGPELVFAQPTGPDQSDRYGMQWMVNLLMRYQGFIGPQFPASLGLEGLFRRIDSFEIGNSTEGGAGVLTLSPVLELILLENLWVGFRANLPLLRPTNREEAFSDPEIAGLYGASYQFFLKTATF